MTGDLFQVQGNEYLLNVDCYSKYPKICCLDNNITYCNIIKTINSIFASQCK